MAKSLNENIKSFYDASTPLWLKVWGEHMHHGYYDVNSNSNGNSNSNFTRIQNGTECSDLGGGNGNKNPQILLIEKLLQFGNITSANRILDAGCGVGGSSRYLAKKFNAEVLGVTLSPVQAANGNRYSMAAGLDNQVTIEALDMMKVDASTKKFDLIWSLESAEHIENKQALFNHFYELLSPGGSLLMITWCHRETPTKLQPDELHLLEKIYKLYHLHPMVSISTLEKMAIKSGFKNIATDDWSDAVAPFWKAVIKSVFQWKSLKGLAYAGWGTIKGAWAMQYMRKGYEKDIIKFGVLKARKP